MKHLIVLLGALLILGGLVSVAETQERDKITIARYEEASSFGITLNIDAPVYFLNLIPTLGPERHKTPTMRAILSIHYFTSQSQPFRFDNRGCTYEFAIKDHKGKTALKKLGPCTASIGYTEILNETATFTKDIEFIGADGKPLPAGTYTIEGRLASTVKMSAIATFEIQEAH